MARKRGPTCRVKRGAWLRPLDKQVGTRRPFVCSSKQRDRLNRGGYNNNNNNNNAPTSRKRAQARGRFHRYFRCFRHFRCRMYRCCRHSWRRQMRAHRQSADMHFTWPAWDKTQFRVGLFRKCVLRSFCVGLLREPRPRDKKIHIFGCENVERKFQKSVLTCILRGLRGTTQKLRVCTESTHEATGNIWRSV